METLQEIASQSAGVPLESAFRFESMDLYRQLGYDWFVSLSTRFYRRVFSDSDDPSFRAVFAGASEDEAVRNQFEWLIQRCGGPPLYNHRKGHPGLMMRHVDFNVTEGGAKRWLEHMSAALQEMAVPPGADPDAKEALMDFFRYMAFFLVAGQCARQARQEGAQAAQLKQCEVEERNVALYGSSLFSQTIRWFTSTSVPVQCSALLLLAAAAACGGAWARYITTAKLKK